MSPQDRRLPTGATPPAPNIGDDYRTEGAALRRTDPGAPPARSGQPGGSAADRALLAAPGRHQAITIGLAAVVVFIGIWQLVASLRIVPELFLPGPLDIAVAEFQYATSPDFTLDLATSGEELLIGFGLAIVIGLPLGILMGWYRRIRYALDPFISFFYSTPRIALMPLLIIWLGIGIWSKVAVIFLGAFFPIAINTLVGVRNLDPDLLKCARSFEASDMQIFRTIALPGAVPFILAGLRLGVGHALIGIVVGELVAAQHGVGQAMSVFGSTFQTAKVFAALIIIAVAGVVLQGLFQRLERHFDAWRVGTAG